MDIVSDIAFPLPAKIIAEMLCVPDEDWNIFRRWASVDSNDPNLARQQGRDFAQRLRQEMVAYSRSQPL